MSQDKLLPQNIEAEMVVLGSILINPEAIVEVADLLEPEHFYRDAHQEIYRAMRSLYDRMIPADQVTLCNLLESQEKLERVGGASYIASLVNTVPTSENAEYYASIVAQKADFRLLIHRAGEIAAIAFHEDEEAVAKSESMIFAISQQQKRADFTPLSTVIGNVARRIDALGDRKGAIVGIPSGFTDLDLMTGGLQDSDLVIVAGRPASGKTSFMLSLALTASVQHKRKVAVFSLEMSKDQLGQRLLSQVSEVDLHRIRMGWIEDNEWERVVYAESLLEQTSIVIDDTPGISLQTMRSRARKLQMQQGVDLILVDYLQLMKSVQDNGKPFGNREQEISAISRGLKEMARELEVPVIALAQLSRALETRQEKRPQPSDLRESGGIENDADIILFPYRDIMYNPEANPRLAELIMAKHRNGPVGTVKVGFEARLTKFHDLDLMEKTNDVQ